MSGEIKDVKMTTVLSVIFSGWHPHHLGQTGPLHQGVVLPQQNVQAVLLQDLGLGYYYYCDITSDCLFISGRK